MIELRGPVALLSRPSCVIIKVYKYGGDLASTWVAKPEVHAENENSRKKTQLNINANDEKYGVAIAA